MLAPHVESSFIFRLDMSLSFAIHRKILFKSIPPQNAYAEQAESMTPSIMDTIPAASHYSILF
jgi:hypothetical protein